jgi:hypothetical protein
MRSARVQATAVLVLLSAAFARRAPAQTSAPAEAASAGATRAAPAIGYGALNQDDITIRLRNDDVEIRVTPLDARLLPLLSNDVARSFQALLDRRRAAIDSVGAANGVSVPGLVLVSFFGQRPRAPFDAELLNLVNRGRLFRPIGILTQSPSFATEQLDVRQSVSAIYIFEEEVPVFEPFSVQYGTITTDDWGQRKLNVLERERGRTASRQRTSGLGRDSVPQ